LEYKLPEVGIPSRYSEYLLIVKSIRQKKSQKINGIGIEKFGIGIDKFEVELAKWN